ncbi:Hypothetical predicted protein, partial [Paramuricea clavata]
MASRLLWLCYIFIISGSYSLLSDTRNSRIPIDYAVKDCETTSALDLLDLWCSLFQKSSFILTANGLSLDERRQSGIKGLSITDDFGSYQTTYGSMTGEGF